MIGRSGKSHRQGYHEETMSPKPKFDPAELEAAGLSEEEALDIRAGIDEVDRNEVIEGADALAQTLAELEALSRARRTG